MRLIQRLLRGKPVPAGMPVNPFGGGKALNGLTEDIKRAVHSLFKPAYMGSAQFEWGAFGEACQWLNASKLTVSRIDLVRPFSIQAKETPTPVVYAVADGHFPDKLQFVTENIKDIYHRASLDFDPHDPTEIKHEGRRTEITVDDWGSLYDEVHDIHVDDRTVTQGDKVVGWFDIGYTNNCRSHAWFLDKRDAHAFRDLIMNPWDTEGTGEVLGGPIKEHDAFKDIHDSLPDIQDVIDDTERKLKPPKDTEDSPVPDSWARLDAGKHDDMSGEVDHE